MANPNPDNLTSERVVSLEPGLPAIPERLLLSHARGRVLFVAGAGVSQPADLPDFRRLVVQVYSLLDTRVHTIMLRMVDDDATLSELDLSDLSDRQIAELRRFERYEFDVVLGMLERRIDTHSSGTSQVRQAVRSKLRDPNPGPAAIHRALVRLSNRGAATSLVTTNFDLLLEDAARAMKVRTATYSLGGIPRPGLNSEFAGILHIHGALERTKSKPSDFIVTDQDFGEFYLRRRVVPDFIYDAARLFNIVLVGYQANDPPMRYLLNAVAADGTRFGDLKERFAFVGSTQMDPVEIQDWKGRGITPIWYDSKDSHAALLATLQRWSELSAINGQQRLIDAAIKRIAKKPSGAANESEKDLFDHLIRRSTANEKMRLAGLASKSKADIGWLDRVISILKEPHGEESK